MSFTNPIDATGYDFPEWMRFAFDRPVDATPWYYTEDEYFECDAPTVLTYYTRLFQSPRTVLSAYNDAQIEQGLWFAVGSQLSDWLWSQELPMELRLDCIQAMPTMFREFLSDHLLETACFMWWDMLRDFGDDPDARIVEAMAAALEEVLQIPVRHCQMSALHGLGHVQHDSKARIIQSFLSTNPDLDAETLAYANAAIAGKVL
jgi:hypothetical protein